MNLFLGSIFSNLVVAPFLKPIIRFLGGLFAIPLFRFLLRRVFKVRTASVEFERDLEHWFRGAVILLAATANLEDALFGWLPWHQHEEPWLTMLFRLLLAIGVVEYMPDQDIFALVHKGPPAFAWKTRRGWLDLWKNRSAYFKGFFALHLRRSSPVFVIMAVIFGGAMGTRDFTIGWVCYGIAIIQYLVIALMVNRDLLLGDGKEQNPTLLKLHEELKDGERGELI